MLCTERWFRKEEKGKEKQQICVASLETTKEYIKTIYFADQFWKLSKKQGGGGGGERTTSSLFLILAIFN